MNCRDVRQGLASGRARRPSPTVERHLESCPECARFADRWSVAARLLQEHHGNAEPDAGFAARVAARLPRGPAEELGWAASRLLPATLALLLVLAWFAAGRAPDLTTDEGDGSNEDLLIWVLDETGGGS